MNKGTNYVPGNNGSNPGSYCREVVLRIVKLVEEGIFRKDLCRQYGMSSNTINDWMNRFGSEQYHRNKKKSFTATQRRQVARAVSEGRMTVKEAALCKGVDPNTIHSWVRQLVKEDKELTVVKQPTMIATPSSLAVGFQNELQQAILKIKALETMIDVAEEHFKIDIRKKSGAKQSGK